MRLLSLELLRYGHLTDVALRFPPEAGLHVVLGSNEAGKSTALSAIGDALFGFPHLTRFAFLHDTAQLRIGFTVQGADGTRAAFIRRKGRKDTLLDADGNPLPELALSRFLGGAGRDLFEKAFGLNAATLRDGAQSLIEGGGAAGEGLLAGMGLPHLRRALERLEKAADELHGTRHRSRRLARAVDAYQAAQRNLDAATVKPAEWTAAQEALERTRQELTALATEAAALKAEELRLRRARALRQPLLALDQARDALAALADAPALPTSAAEDLARLKAALAKAEEDAAREGQAALRLEQELAALRRDPAVLAVQDLVDALAETRSTALGAARDLPALRRAAETEREAVARAAARLGLEDPPEAVREALPRESHRQAAQRLMTGRARLQAKLDSAEQALRAAASRMDTARQTLAAAISPPAADTLRRAIEATRAEGPLDRDLATAEAEWQEAERRTATALAALNPSPGDAAALAACPLPLPAAAEEVARHLDAARATEDVARRELVATTEEVAQLEADLAHLARGETVPTPEVIAAARGERDAVWRRLRGMLEGAPPDPTLPAAFEALRDRADRLADARADDAQRVNDYAAKSTRLAWLRRQQAAQESALAEAVAALEAAELAWRALWAPAGFMPLSPPAMQQWRAARDAVLDLANRATALRMRRDALRERRTAAIALLAPLLDPPAEAAALAPLLIQAEAQAARLEAAEAAHRKLVEAAAQAARQREEAAAAREAAAAELAASAASWEAALATLRLPLSAGLEEVEEALSTWSAIATAGAAWRSAESRIAEMEAAMTKLARDAAALAETLGEAQGEETPEALAARLARRLAEAREAETASRTLQRQLQDRRREMAAAQQARQAAEAALARLHAAAGTTELPDLEAAVQRAAERTRLLAEVTRLEVTLREQGEGLPEHALRAEQDGFDPAEALARLEEIAARVEEIGHRRTQLGSERQRQEDALAALQAGRDAASHAQDARDALAEAQEAAERFARLHAARFLLKAGIERLRQDSQGPMLRAAAQHFALLTGGRYTRLVTDEQEDGSPLLRAVQADGTTCPLDQLSEGARDQLYLALRVAALEARAAAAEPLPFVADDLLASFDDTRATAALRLLQGLGRSTQAILFTHHAHVAALARRLPGVSVQVLGEAATAPGALSVA